MDYGSDLAGLFQGFWLSVMIRYSFFLHYKCVNQEAVCLLKQYLSRRTQRVYLNGKILNSLGMKSGVPQGSGMGPLLNLIYTSSIPSGGLKLLYALLCRRYPALPVISSI